MKTIEVLVIRPPRWYIDGATHLITPQEVLLPTILENNSISSRFLNVDFPRLIPQIRIFPPFSTYLNYESGLNNFLGDEKNIKWKYGKYFIKKLDPSIALLVKRMPNDFSVTIKMAEIIKNNNPETIIGTLAINEREATIFLKNPFIDFVIVGEPEYTLLEVSREILKNGFKKDNLKKIKGLAFKGKKGVIFTKERELEYNLDNFPIPNKDLVIDKNYYPPSSFGLIEGGRGCKYSCSFCVESPPLRLRSPEIVAREIVETYQRYKTRDFLIELSSVLHNPLWTKKLHKLLMKYHLPIMIGCYANANQITRKSANLLKEMGCYKVCIGIESGSVNILKKLNKIPNIENGRILNFQRVRKILKENGIFFRSSFIIGHPEETYKDLIESLKLLRKLNPDSFRLQFLIPKYGTKVYKEVKKRKLLLDENPDRFMSSENLIKTKISPQKLREIWKKYNQLNYIKERIFFRKIFLHPKRFLLKMSEYSYFLFFRAHL